MRDNRRFIAGRKQKKMTGNEAEKRSESDEAEESVT
jgi:hypothetical protein